MTKLMSVVGSVMLLVRLVSPSDHETKLYSVPLMVTDPGTVIMNTVPTGKPRRTTGVVWSPFVLVLMVMPW